LTIDDYLGPDCHQEIADGFYDRMGFGLDGVHSGFLLMIDMNQRMQYISTTGNMITLLDDAAIDKALDVTTPYMHSGQYLGAVIALLDYATAENAAYWNSTSLEP
jgi:uncharacterized protein